MCQSSSCTQHSNLVKLQPCKLCVSSTRRYLSSRHAGTIHEERAVDPHGHQQLVHHHVLQHMAKMTSKNVMT